MALVPSNIQKKVEGKVNKALYSFGLVQDGDKILVGISGGKDSYALLDLLVSRRKVLPFNYTIEACHVVATDLAYTANTNYMEEYCSTNDIPLYIKEITIEYNPNQRKPICFICSWKRRKALFSLAKELKCNKLALGHHLDDAIETLLLNMVNNSSISSIPPMLSMFNGYLFAIRPLILLTNKELTLYAAHKKFPDEITVCPYHKDSQRDSIRKLIDQMEILNRSARKNIFQSMGNIFDEYLAKQ
jgi:tRNA 2-thiocytidine biosynthesis protein TtcA